MMLLLLFTPACRFTEDESPKAVKGVLDLTHWDFGEDGPVYLNGEYEFYWKEHVSPSNFSNASHQSLIFVNVPGFWNNQVLEGKRLSGKGYASYRLRVLLNGVQQSLAMRIQDMGTAYAAYVNGHPLGSVGVPGKNRETTVPRYYPRVMGINEKSDCLDIVFHVSNFHHRRGGAWEPIQLGEETQLRDLMQMRVGIALSL